MSPIASVAAPTCEPRIVVRYPGAVLLDLGSHIEIEFTGTPARGLRGYLRYLGWVPTRKGNWRKVSNAAAIFEAQDALKTFQGEALA